MGRNRMLIALALRAIFLGALPSIAGAEIVVELMDTSGHVFTDEERAAIKEIAAAAEAELRSLLPQLPTRILLTVLAGADVIPETGETGAAVAPGYVRWTVD